MKHDSTTLDRPNAAPGVVETLRGDLAAEAAAAKPSLEPIYRYILRKVDAGEPLPRWGEVPHKPRIISEGGFNRGKARHGMAVLEAWLPRLRAAFGEGGEHRAEFEKPPAKERAAPTEMDEAALARLRAERGAAAPRDRPIFDLLVKLATTGEPIPMTGSSVNLLECSRLAGTYHHVALKNREALNRWAGRLRQTRTTKGAYRKRLPGCDLAGTDVPTATLIAALEKALADETDAVARSLLSKLIEIAKSTRELPRYGRRPNLAALCHSAGVPGDFRRTQAARIVKKWIGFFELAEEITQIRPDGSIDTHRSAEVAVRRHLETLGKTPLYTCHKPPLAPSWVAIGRAVNMRGPDIMHGVALELVMAHWRKFGPGPVYEGMSGGERRALKARRTELLAFAKQETIAGRTLPARRDRTRLELDHDELVRRLGRPGANLADDPYFRTLLFKLDPKPKLARYQDVGGVPSSYDQLFDGFQAHRTARVGAGSVSSTRGAIRRALTHFRSWLGKKGHDPLAEDFQEPQFANTVAAIVEAGACGTPTRNFEIEMRAARDWLAQRDVDMLGDDLATVLTGAIQRDGRSLPDIIEGTGCDIAEVTSWMKGNSGPHKESMPALVPLALSLGLAEDRLSKLVGSFARGGAKRGRPIRLPDGVRPHMPDNWQTLPEDEQRLMAEWIDDNLLHQNTMFGRTMREAARRRRLAKDATEAERATLEFELDDGKDETEPLEPANDDEPTEPMDDEPSRPDEVGYEEPGAQPLGGAARKAAEAIGRHIDDQLTTTSTRLGKVVLGELKELRRHMTLNFPDRFMRRPGVKWRSNSTAPMKLAMITRFLRWQAMPEENDGLGRDPDDLTLGDLLHPPLLFAYVDFKARSMEHVTHDGRERGFVFTGSEVDIIQTVKSLVSKEFGFITQRPELVERIVPDERRLPSGSFVSLDGHVYGRQENKREEEGEDLAEAGEDAEAPEIMPASFARLVDEDFVSACRRAEVMYATAQRHVDTEAEMIRDPLEAIQPILDTPQPMTTLLRQLALASLKAPNARSAALQHHTFKRDLLMARLFALTCLRSKNMREITSSGPGAKLRFDVNEGKWLLQIPRGEFKNPDNAVLFGRRRKRQPYRKWIENRHGLYDLITYYLETSRPFFVDHGRRRKRGAGSPVYREPDELFLSSCGRPLAENMMWRAVRNFVARYVAWNPFRNSGIALVAPFGPHAFRDIRATDILLNPETTDPYLEAALALQTGRQMIQDHYGIIKTERRTAQDDVSFFKREDLAWQGLKAA